MSSSVRNVLLILVGVVAGVVINIGLHIGLPITNNAKDIVETRSKKSEPLYWVAPMDPNYKRDKPGKSPMGMDLIPFYGESSGENDSGPGTVRISPDVINNLGVRTAKVVQKALHNEIQTVGYVTYDENQLIHIHPRVEGWIEKLHVKAEGNQVKKGEPLYSLYSPALVNAQEELLLALERNNQRLIQASEDRLLSLQVSADAVKELKNSRKVKQTITHYAPQSGVVAKLNIREGFFVMPGTSMMTIGALDEIWVEAEVFERQVPMVKDGSPVTMTLDYLPGRKWQGVVDYIYPTLDPKTRTAKVRLRFNNSDFALMPNMFAQVTIHNHRQETALLIPREAVIRTGSKNRVVLALGEGRFKSIDIAVGHFDEDYAEILSGLQEGDTVVSSAQFLLDSESSKTSDFRRMNHDDNEEKPQSVWVEATIKSLMTGHRMVTVEHLPIKEWNWPEMTMDFIVSDSVDMDALKSGMTLHIQIEQQSENQYVITNVHIPNNAAGQIDEGHASTDHNSARVKGIINQIDQTSRVLTVSREAIEKWNRPPATLDFSVSDSIDLSKLTEGMTIDFTFSVSDEGNFLIQHIESLSAMTHDTHEHQH